MRDRDFDPRVLLAECPIGVLATIRPDGRPQLSPVMPHYEGAGGRILVSTQEGLVKTRNLRREPWAALQVTSADGLAWATAEGPVTMTGPGADPDGPEVEALVGYYRAAAGEHPSWEEYRRVMVAERRVLVTLAVEHVYGDRVGGLS